MAVDAAKKASVEKKIVLGLLGLFGLTLSGALRGVVGTHGSSTVSAPVIASVATTPPPAQPLAIRHVMSQAIKKVEDAVAFETRSPAPSAERSGSTSERLYTAQALRDPMESLMPQELPKVAATPAAPQYAPEAPPEPPPALRVRGVLWGGKDAQAIINDKVYRIGDMVAGVKILAIDRRGVTVEYRGAPMMYTTAAQTTETGRTPARQARWR